MLERSPNEVELPLLAEPQTTAKLPPLIEPQLTDISPLALGLEGCEEAKTAERDRLLPSRVVVQDAVRSFIRNKTPPRGRGQAQTLVSTLSSFLCLLSVEPAPSRQPHSCKGEAEKCERRRLRDGAAT
jgi:hypothetical protein